LDSVAVTSRSFSSNEFLSKELLKLYPNAKFNDAGEKLSGQSLIKFLAGYNKAIIALENVNVEVISNLPDLKVISKYGVGLDMLDVHALSSRNIKLGWKPGVNRRSVSELVISLAINLLHRVSFANNEVKKGDWYQVIGNQLSNKTFGIVGCGNIGKDLVSLLQPFGCKILVNDIKDYKDFFTKFSIEKRSIEDLVSDSDIISLHLPKNQSTIGIINKNIFDLFKKDSILINYARGGLVDEKYLFKALIEKKIGGAAIDVLEIEPPKEYEFAQIDNLIVTPHIGGSTEESIKAMGLAAIQGLDDFSDPLDYIDY